MERAVNRLSVSRKSALLVTGRHIRIDELQLDGSRNMRCLLPAPRVSRRHRGTYGGRGWIKDGEASVANLEVTTPLDGLLCVGDSRFPGPGVPAVAAGGMVAAHSLVPFTQQLGTIDRVCA